VGHELKGSEFYSLTPKEDKPTKLSTTNTILARSEYTDIPISNKTDPSSPEDMIWHYLKEIALGQSRCYCKVATLCEKAKFHQQGFLMPCAPLFVLLGYHHVITWCSSREIGMQE
jgi:hypothetical protein